MNLMISSSVTAIKMINFQLSFLSSTTFSRTAFQGHYHGIEWILHLYYFHLDLNNSVKTIRPKTSRTKLKIELKPLALLTRCIVWETQGNCYKFHACIITLHNCSLLNVILGDMILCFSSSISIDLILFCYLFINLVLNE